MNEVPAKQVIEDVAAELEIAPAFVEKDWYVTQVIKLMADFSFEDSRTQSPIRDIESKYAGSCLNENIDGGKRITGIEVIFRSSYRKSRKCGILHLRLFLCTNI